jgi:hypothetical protein
MFMHARFLPCWLAAVAVSLFLTGCQYVQPEKIEKPTALPQLNTADAQIFTIDSGRSIIQLKVYRDGMLARLGHNHIISASQISGTVYRREPISRTTFSVIFPVAALLVDRPADRRRAGADFPGEIPQGHIDGTRANMLGPDLLQGDQFATVELRSLGMEGRPTAAIWHVAVRVRDQISELRVPVQISQNGKELTVQGAVKLSQRQLGLQPFCVLGGKLCVRDDIDAEFYLVATSSP